MNCPVCNNVRMREVEKDDVTIDVCPDCKGVWLDRGELEKLMSGVREERQQYNDWYNDHNYRSPKNDYERDNDHRYDPGYRSPNDKHRKKKNILDRLGDLFD